MAESLPHISIKVDITPREFIDRLKQIAELFGGFDVHRAFDLPGFEGWGSLNLTPNAPNQHEELCGQVLATPENDPRVFIEMTAKRWFSDPPTYEIYVEAARILFEPLIRAYNKKYNSRRRLNIQAKAVKEPTLPPETKKQFKTFVICANKSALHPNDWTRFYHFVRFCHAHHVKLSESQLRYLLVKVGFTSEKAEHLAEIYYHGRRILAL